VERKCQRYPCSFLGEAHPVELSLIFHFSTKSSPYSIFSFSPVPPLGCPPLALAYYGHSSTEFRVFFCLPFPGVRQSGLKGLNFPL
jgi:hypothetical protein